VGIVVPRHRRSAVDRNRLKRRIRELVRLDLLGSLRRSSPVDVAIRARPEAYTATVPALRADVDVVRARLATDSSAE
jgi:ribonuclease P protein component